MSTISNMRELMESIEISEHSPDEWSDEENYVMQSAVETAMTPLLDYDQYDPIPPREDLIEMFEEVFKAGYNYAEQRYGHQEAPANLSVADDPESIGDLGRK